MTPSWYRWSEEGATTSADVPGTLRPVEATDARITECRNAQARQRIGVEHFSYPSDALWRLQFIDRTLPTESLADPELGIAMVEKQPRFDRLLTAIPNRADGWLDLATAVWRRALRSGRRFFAFATGLAQHEQLTERCRLGGTPGFVTILPGTRSGVGKPVPTGLLIEHGDRL